MLCCKKLKKGGRRGGDAATLGHIGFGPSGRTSNKLLKKATNRDSPTCPLTEEQEERRPMSQKEMSQLTLDVNKLLRGKIS